MQYVGWECDRMHGNKQADARGCVGLGLPLHVQLCGDISQTDVCFADNTSSHVLRWMVTQLKADRPVCELCNMIPHGSTLQDHLLSQNCQSSSHAYTLINN